MSLNQKKNNNHLRTAAIALLSAMLILPAIGLSQQPRQSAFQPQIPLMSREDDKRVFLEGADLLNKVAQDTFLVLSGNVRFTRGGMHMFCDSAHYSPESGSLSAFGNVRMEQGDTLFIYADTMHYNDTDSLGWLLGWPVRMINRDVKLETDEFIYDFSTEIGYYLDGGKLYDSRNVLTSVIGEYIPSTKEANFYKNVKLRSLSDDASDTLYIFSDTLFYNTDDHVARLSSPSMVINKGDTIFTSNGLYNTEIEEAQLFDRSTVRMGRGTTLIGDTLFYDKIAGYGWARGNMELIDSARQTTLSGDYGFYDQIADSCYVTGRALCREYSQGDTLYMHGREIFSYAVFDTIKAPLLPADSLIAEEHDFRVDTTHIIVAHPRVRFFRSDMQGLCDSVTFTEKDSTLLMHRHPIVWNEGNQIFGNIISLHFNDSTIDRATLPETGFTAQRIEGDYYNQLSGKEMIALFEGGQLSRLDVKGNVEGIMLPMENDSTYNKVINMQSSFLTALFSNNEVVWLKTWPETSGEVTPLYLSNKSMFFLPRFRWFEALRPTSPASVFIVPPEMDDLMNEP